MGNTSIMYVNHVPVVVPTQQGPHTTKFLLQMSNMLKDNRTSVNCSHLKEGASWI